MSAVGFSKVRCTLCGASRLLNADGSTGACSLIGCPDPMADVRKDTERFEGPCFRREYLLKFVDGETGIARRYRGGAADAHVNAPVNVHVCVVCNGKKRVVIGQRRVCCMEGMPEPTGDRWLAQRCEECSPNYVTEFEACRQCHGTGLLLAPSESAMSPPGGNSVGVPAEPTTRVCDSANHGFENVTKGNL